jgi:hypothetical protein
MGDLERFTVISYQKDMPWSGTRMNYYFASAFMVVGNNSFLKYINIISLSFKELGFGSRDYICLGMPPPHLRLT